MEGINNKSLTVRVYPGQHIDVINMGPEFDLQNKADVSEKAIYIMSPLSRATLESFVKPEILNAEYNAFKELGEHKQTDPAIFIVLDNLSMFVEQFNETFMHDGEVFGKVTVKSMMDYYPLIHQAFLELEAYKHGEKQPFVLSLTDEAIQTLELVHAMYTSHLGYQLTRTDNIYVYIPDVVNINVQSVGPTVEQMYDNAIRYLYEWPDRMIGGQGLPNIHMMDKDAATELFNGSPDDASEYFNKFIDVCAKVHSDSKFRSTYQTAF